MPDLIVSLGEMPKKICDCLDVAGCLVLTKNHDGTIGFAGHGLNHHTTNELCSVGIHINLSQHDAMVRAGAAGEAAQRVALELAAGAAS